MTETEKHKDLKKLAHFILYKEGFNESEIQEEHSFKVPGSKKRFRIDVLGIMDRGWGKNKKIAVELGTTNPKKLAQLELFFDKVIHIPYGIEGFTEIKMNQILNLKKENDSLKSDITKLNKVILDKKNIITRFEKEQEYEEQTTYALRILRAIQGSLVNRRTMLDALEDSKDKFCPRYPYNSKKNDMDLIVENIYKTLFGEIEFDWIIQ